MTTPLIAFCDASLEMSTPYAGNGLLFSQWPENSTLPRSLCERYLLRCDWVQDKPLMVGLSGLVHNVDVPCAELMAVCADMEILNEFPEKPSARVYTDSKTVVDWLKPDRELWDCSPRHIRLIAYVRRIIFEYDWQVHHNKGHVGILGNEIVDRLAVRRRRHPEMPSERQS